MYQQQQPGPGAEGQAGPQAGEQEQASSKKKDDDVVDADFKEV